MKLFQRPQILGLLCVTLAMSSLAEAQTPDAVYRYRQSGPWGDVSDGTLPGWGLNPDLPGDGVPDTNDEARINFGFNTVTLDFDAPDLLRVLIGVDESGILEVQNGGELTTTQDLVVGNNGFVDAEMYVQNGATVDVGRILWLARGPNVGDTFAVFNIEAGGVVNVASHLWWAPTGTAIVEIAGQLNQTGGILGLGTNDFSVFGGSAEVTIVDGGEMNLNNIFTTDGATTSIQPGSFIDLEGTGRLTVNGDLVDALQIYVDAGLVLGGGVQGAVDIVLEFGAVDGDFNADGVVDAADYTVYRDNIGNVNGLPNDGGLGTVGQQHYDLWEAQYGMQGDVTTVATAAVAAAQAVPEPGALLMLCGLLLPGMAGGRKRSS